MLTKRYESSNSKLKKIEKLSFYIESQKGVMDKFIKINKK